MSSERITELKAAQAQAKRVYETDWATVLSGSYSEHGQAID